MTLNNDIINVITPHAYSDKKRIYYFVQTKRFYREEVYREWVIREFRMLRETAEKDWQYWEYVKGFISIIKKVEI